MRRLSERWVKMLTLRILWIRIRMTHVKVVAIRVYDLCRHS